MKQLLKFALCMMLITMASHSNATTLDLASGKFDWSVNQQPMFGQNQKFSSPFRNQNLLLAPQDGEYGMGIMSGFISLAAPGVGLYLANKAYISLAFLPICYGLVGSGVATMLKGKKQATDNYASYMVEKNPTLQIEYFDLAEEGKELNKAGQVRVMGGLAVWGIQTVWTFIYGYYNDLYRARDAKWKNSTSFIPSGGYDFNTKTTTLNLSIKF